MNRPKAEKVKKEAVAVWLLWPLALRAAALWAVGLTASALLVPDDVLDVAWPMLCQIMLGLMALAGLECLWEAIRGPRD